MENLVERALILCHEQILRIDPAMVTLPLAAEPAAGRTLQDEERRHILKVLTLADWQIEGPGAAAEQLGLAPSTLRSRMQKLGIRRPARL
ncbi:MAG: hypothetical protein L6Q38_01255 [Nitrospira sp.]|nr:hypothetical protein [Nitrospira sp.]